LTAAVKANFFIGGNAPPFGRNDKAIVAEKQAQNGGFAPLFRHGRKTFLAVSSLTQAPSQSFFAAKH